MSRSVVSKDRILACRLNDEEEKLVDAAAHAAGVKPATFLRLAVLERVKQSLNPSQPKPRSWADEFAAIQNLKDNTAVDRFTKLAAGRRLPPGFWNNNREVQVAWLDKEWPL